MAIKHVKEYYKQVEKMYLELLSSLNEMQQDFKAGEVTEDELNNLLIPVQGIKENYLRLSYVMHLLFQPEKKKKLSKYEKQNRDRVEYFKDNNLTAEQDLQTEKDVLNKFKETVKEYLKNKENKNG